MDKLEAVNQFVSVLTPERIRSLTDEEITNMAMERPGHPGVFGFLLDPRFFRSDEHLEETLFALTKRLGEVGRPKENGQEIRKVTYEEFVQAHNAASNAAREKIRAGGDLEKQKTCEHPFDSWSGDLLHGPCVCDECGKVIVK
jgi:hypothetical protein